MSLLLCFHAQFWCFSLAGSLLVVLSAESEWTTHSKTVERNSLATGSTAVASGAGQLFLRAVNIATRG